MTSAPTTPSSVEATTALLRSELPELETQQQSLEKELATVTERLESVRTALTALEALSVTPVAQPAADAPEPEVSPAPAPEAQVPAQAAAPAEEASADPVAQPPAAAEEPKRAKRRPAKKAAPAKPAKAAKPAGAAKPAKAAKAAKPAGAAKPAEAKKAAATSDEDDKSGGLTEQILDVLAASGATPVRAREVAEALGRDATPGSINAVRSTLDRLVGSSRARRAGRGLYGPSDG
ncbi:hypothetical protein [Streptomyces corynorhini]|uniref:Uncharacterized protein n=1 Tax=Streptomyces corynorhini TaxID=2282652 RepID=A0A370BJR0_9ACTN|nr:hypothetical protein [Streptomyces corynorhini]RDG39993.1 hypothetical protein DVH02_00760 [Streptomyces corynorhini]